MSIVSRDKVIVTARIGVCAIDVGKVERRVSEAPLKLRGVELERRAVEMAEVRSSIKLFFDYFSSGSNFLLFSNPRRMELDAILMHVERGDQVEKCMTLLGEHMTNLRELRAQDVDFMNVDEEKMRGIIESVILELKQKVPELRQSGDNDLPDRYIEKSPQGYRLSMVRKAEIASILNELKQGESSEEILNSLEGYVKDLRILNRIRNPLPERPRDIKNHRRSMQVLESITDVKIEVMSLLDKINLIYDFDV